MLKQHGIQKRHARENVLYQAIMRRSSPTTRCLHLLALHNDSQKLLLRFCVFNKSELHNFTFNFLFQDELIQVEAGNHQTETTVIQQKFHHQFNVYSLRNQTMITPDN